MKNFDGLTHMRVEILIDPDTLDYQADIEGRQEVIIAVLEKVLEDLKNPEIVQQLAVED